MLEMLFANIVEITASVSILILLLLALTPLLRRRYAAKWRYWVWFALAAPAFDSAQYFTAQGAGAGADPEPDSAFRAGGRYRRTDFGGAACRWGRAGADSSSCGRLRR